MELISDSEDSLVMEITSNQYSEDSLPSTNLEIEPTQTHLTKSNSEIQSKIITAKSFFLKKFNQTCIK